MNPTDDLIFSAPLIHQYAQDSWHDESLIYATRDGLLALRAAIDQALETGHGFTSASAHDGEGYYALVVCANEADFDKAQSPYCNPEVFSCKSGIHPECLPGVDVAHALAYTSSKAHYEKSRAKNVESGA
jgi:hypothetical protein